MMSKFITILMLLLFCTTNLADFSNEHLEFGAEREQFNDKGGKAWNLPSKDLKLINESDPSSYRILQRFLFDLAGLFNDREDKKLKQVIRVIKQELASTDLTTETVTTPTTTQESAAHEDSPINGTLVLPTFDPKTSSTPEELPAEESTTEELPTSESSTTEELTTSEISTTEESTTSESSTTEESTTSESSTTEESATSESSTTEESTTTESISTPEELTTESSTIKLTSSGDDSTEMTTLAPIVPVASDNSTDETTSSTGNSTFISVLRTSDEPSGPFFFDIKAHWDNEKYGDKEFMLVIVLYVLIVIFLVLATCLVFFLLIWILKKLCCSKAESEDDNDDRTSSNKASASNLNAQQRPNQSAINMPAPEFNFVWSSNQPYNPKFFVKEKHAGQQQEVEFPMNQNPHSARLSQLIDGRNK